MTPRDEVGRRVRGLYGIADAGGGRDPVRLGALWLEGGCRLVQLRAKGWPHDALLAAARDLRARCDAVGATFIVNDDAEVAAATAHGVHVGPTDAALDAVRRVVGPDRIVGRSTNDPDQVRAALAGADYLAFGPVWDTPHLSRLKVVRGLDGLVAARAIVPADVPLVAIGGIRASRLAEVVAAGADAWAVIGAVADAPDPVAAVRSQLRGPERS